MRRVTSLAAAVVAGALALTACGSSSSGTSTTSPAASGSSTSAAPSSSGGGAPKADFKVGLAYDIGGRGDQSFNDAAARGLDKAKTELGVETKELEATSGETDASKEERLRLLAQGGYNVIVAVGFAYAPALKKVAAEFPKVNFAIVDDASVTGANIANLVFAEQEGSFLVGAAAALMTKKDNVGFVGGVNTPLIQKFQAGYEQGAKAAKAGVKVQVKYLTQPPDFSGFTDPAKGKTAAAGMFDNGADVVFHAAGGSGGGVFEAAKAAGGMAIGVDSDQYVTATAAVKDVIITSMIKKVDVAVYDYIKSVADGSPLNGVQTFDLKKGGVDYSTSGGKIDAIKPKLDEYKAQIIAGTIKVSDKPAG